MNTCETCKHWHQGQVNWIDMGLVAQRHPTDYGSCDSDKFIKDCELRPLPGIGGIPTNRAIVEYDEGWAFTTGKDFGCVHWTRKETA